MPLREDFQRQGHWLFRWRSYLPVLLLVPVAASVTSFRYPGGSHLLDRVWELSCLALSLSGLAVRAKTIGHTPRGTSGRNTAAGQVAETLNTTGMYSVVRHPLYLGNFLMWMGVALFPHNAALAVIVALCFWLYYERIMFAEEEFLRERFGAAYESWAQRTPAFVPHPWRWTPPSLPFSLRNVLKRENSGFYAVILLLTAMELVAENAVRGGWRLDDPWPEVFAVGTATYLLLLILKRHTRLLRVDGR